MLFIMLLRTIQSHCQEWNISSKWNLQTGYKRILYQDRGWMCTCLRECIDRIDCRTCSNAGEWPSFGGFDSPETSRACEHFGVQSGCKMLKQMPCYLHCDQFKRVRQRNTEFMGKGLKGSSLTYLGPNGSHLLKISAFGEIGNTW